MLKLEHVSKTFNLGTVNEKKALQDLNLTINDGDFITIIGGNGAGKSTTFRRGKRRGLSWGISKEEKKQYHEALKRLDLGLETRMSSKVGLLSGGQRQALTLLMATLQKPKILLLDEHTAALDPRTAKKVLDLTEEIVTEQKLTALMVTHNMKDAINIGNRLIMMDKGRIIYDVNGEEKAKLTVDDLLKKFEEASGSEFDNDRMLLG